MKCMQKFASKTSWKTAILKTEKEVDLMGISYVYRQWMVMSNGGEELCSAAGATELLCEYATM